LAHFEVSKPGGKAGSGLCDAQEEKMRRMTSIGSKGVEEFMGEPKRIANRE